MFTGVNFEKAIDYWKKGREVIVIDRNSRTENGGYDNFSFEELFRNVELLADVPACIPEVKLDEGKLKNAVMHGACVIGEKGATGDLRGAVDSSEEKNVTPPLRTAGGE